MKRFILGLLIMMTFSVAFSQKQYFIYLQSEPEQVFFVKMNEKIHNSTSSGYLILSRLVDSTYNFSVGFPQNKWPEQKFAVEVKAKDHGYLLKNFGEKGWGLFDLQSMAIQMSSAIANNTSQKTEQREVSEFTAILSKAANDPSLKEKPVTPPPVVIKEDKKTAAEQTVIIKEDPPVLTKEQPSVKTEDVKKIPVEEYKRSIVTKRSETSASDGLSVIYIDDYGNGKKDTIRIIIPNQKINSTGVKEPPKEDKKFLDITENDTVKKSDSDLTPAKTETLPVSTIAKNNCSSIASESDFLKLRKKMAAETNDDGMVDEAKKYFKTKCFAVSQIKNLSTLFLNDNGKYKFFDAAYVHVSDPENFSSLVTELKDEYYISRFKAMLR